MKIESPVNPVFNCIKYIKTYDEDVFTKHMYNDSIVRGNYVNCLISILFNTNNLDNTLHILNQFYNKTKNPKKIQFCIKIDNDNKAEKDKFLQELSKFKFNFIILASPKGRGFIDLWQWVNFLYKSSSKNATFVMNISDEMYIENKDWDVKLESYINYFNDGIFRLRTSVFKNRNYTDIFECGYAPDTTAIYTRKYLNIQGDFSPCFGPDNGQQLVAYYLSKINLPRHYQFSRDIVTEGINFIGQGTNIGLTENQKLKRNNLNIMLWKNLYKYKNQNLLFKRARKIQIEILKKNFKNLQIKNFGNIFQIKLCINKEDKILNLNNNLSKVKFTFNILTKLDFIKHNTGYDSGFLRGYIINFYISIFKRLPKTKEKNYTKVNNFDIFIIGIMNKKYFQFLQDDIKNSKTYNSHYISFLRFYSRNSHFISFLRFYSRLIVSLILLMIFFLLNPNKIPVTFLMLLKKIFKFKKVNSHILSLNQNDQSKTIVIKGD